MNFWETFWPIVLIVSVVAFAGIAIVVAIGGISDIRAMLRSIERDHKAARENPDDRDAN